MRQQRETATLAQERAAASRAAQEREAANRAAMMHPPGSAPERQMMANRTPAHPGQPKSTQHQHHQPGT
jgi:hypothetical protein